MSIISQTSLPGSTPDILLSNVTADAAVIVGDWVRINSMGTAVKAFADSADNANVIGLVESKPTATTAVIRVLGISASIFVGLDTTKEYFLSDITAGTMTEQGVNIPTDPGHVVLKLGKPLNSTQFLVLPGTRFVRS